MNVSRNLMDIYFGYNMSVGDLKGTKESITDFEQIAQNASSPEERERYAQAAAQLKNEVLPQVHKDMEQFGKRLGLNSSQIGETVQLESDSLAKLALKQNNKGILSFLTPYESGSFYHNKA